MAKFYNGFVINPESYWQPAFRISPFNTSYISTNYKLVQNGNTDELLLTGFFGENFILCNSGKQAIQLALQQYHLQADDEVWIHTTSGNQYISGCVTKEIEKFCNWSRQKSEKTKLIFVNHEFGYCYKNLQDLKAYRLPIIEDRALSFASVDDQHLTGTVGDFVIYSLPKFFPINIGGVLQCNNPNVAQGLTAEAGYNPLSILLTHYLQNVEEIKNKRKVIYNIMETMFAGLSFQPRFALGEGEVPGVFMFRADGLNLIQLKTFMQGNGIESSVFYGEDAFFLPLHQGLTEKDCAFFYQLVNYFKQYGNQ